MVPGAITITHASTVDALDD